MKLGPVIKSWERELGKEIPDDAMVLIPVSIKLSTIKDHGLREQLKKILLLEQTGSVKLIEGKLVIKAIIHEIQTNAHKTKTISSCPKK